MRTYYVLLHRTNVPTTTYYQVEFSYPSWFSPEVKELLSRILTRYPETRYGVAGIKRSAWFAVGGYREEQEDEELDTLERRRGVEAAFDETDLEDLESAEIDPDPDPNRRISAGVPVTPSANRSASEPRHLPAPIPAPLT